MFARLRITWWVLLGLFALAAVLLVSLVARRGAPNVRSLHPAAMSDYPVDAMLDSLVPALLAAYRVPGAGVAWLEAGEVTWMRGVGEADLANGRPVTPATAFNIGSISKVFAAWTALDLVERGALDLDAPIRNYLTRWSFPPSEFDASGVTARRILRHRAGLSLSGYPGFGPEAQLPTLEESLAGATNGADDVRLIAEPGTDWAYSGGGFTVLQLAIEEITGRPFADVARENILIPAGMSDSGFELTADIESALARPYSGSSFWSGEPTEVPMVRFTALAAAGMISTLEDMVSFVRWLAEPAGVNDSSWQRKWVEGLQEIDGDETIDYIYGHQVRRFADLVTVGHVGSNTGWTSHFQMAPSTGGAFIVMTNSSDGFSVHNAIACHWYWRATRELNPEFCWIFED